MRCYCGVDRGGWVGRTSRATSQRVGSSAVMIVKEEEEEEEEEEE